MLMMPSGSNQRFSGIEIVAIECDDNSGDTPAARFLELEFHDA